MPARDAAPAAAPRRSAGRQWAPRRTRAPARRPSGTARLIVGAIVAMDVRRQRARGPTRVDRSVDVAGAFSGEPNQPAARRIAARAPPRAGPRRARARRPRRRAARRASASGPGCTSACQCSGVDALEEQAFGRAAARVAASDQARGEDARVVGDHAVTRRRGRSAVPTVRVRRQVPRTSIDHEQP